MPKKFFNDPALQKEFEQQGFVKIPFLSSEEVKKTLSFMQTLRPDDSFRPDGNRAGNPFTAHATSLDTNLEYRKNVFDFGKEQFATRISNLFCSYKILSINFINKQPGYGKFHIHQNWDIVPTGETSIVVWCPLVDITDENGGLQVVPGSHKIVGDITTIGAVPYSRKIEDVLAKEYLQLVHMKAGEAVLFDDGLLHCSSNNNSDTPRPVFSIQMVPDDVTPVYHYYDATTNTFELFEIDDEFLVNNGLTKIIERPENIKSMGNVKSLGIIPNRNMELTLEQFKIRMKNGPARRAQIYGRRTIVDRISDKVRSVFS